jgi:ribosome-associated protein
MREIDSEPLKATLAQWARGPAAERARFTEVERWRERVLAETEALADFVNAYPAADRASLARLVADAHAERARGAPARKFRELFRELKRIVDAATTAER